MREIPLKEAIKIIPGKNLKNKNLMPIILSGINGLQARMLI